MTILEKYQEVATLKSCLEHQIFDRVVAYTDVSSNPRPPYAESLSFIDENEAYYTWDEFSWGSSYEESLSVPLKYLENDNWLELYDADQLEAKRVADEHKSRREKAAEAAKVQAEIAERDRLLNLHPIN